MASNQSNERNRAEHIRARRKQNRKETLTTPVRTNATRKKYEHKVPVSHRWTAPTPAIKRQKNKVNVPLKTKGAELQLPAFPKLNPGWRFISGLIFLLSSAIVMSFTSLGTFKVNTMSLTGGERLTAETLFSQMDLTGVSIIQIDPEKVESQFLDRFPSLKEIEVTVSLPAGLNVQIKERQPVILWQQDASSMWIDAEGVMFPVSGESEVQLFVVANALPPQAPDSIEKNLVEEQSEIPAQDLTSPRTTPEFIEGLLTLSGYLPENTNLHYDTQFGLGWQDSYGWMVYFGKDIINMDIKLAEYQTIIAALQKDNITPAMINVEFLHAPFYRMEQ